MINTTSDFTLKKDIASRVLAAHLMDDENKSHYYENVDTSDFALPEEESTYPWSSSLAIPKQPQKSDDGYLVAMFVWDGSPCYTELFFYNPENKTLTLNMVTDEDELSKLCTFSFSELDQFNKENKIKFSNDVVRVSENNDLKAESVMSSIFKSESPVFKLCHRAADKTGSIGVYWYRVNPDNLKQVAMSDNAFESIALYGDGLN
jgi:hypothetical protein